MLIQILVTSCSNDLDFILPQTQHKINDTQLPIFGLVRDMHIINDSICLFIANRTVLTKFNYKQGQISQTLHIDSLFDYTTALQKFALTKYPNRQYFYDKEYTQPKTLFVSSVNTPKGYLTFLKVLSPYKTQEENTTITTYTFEFFALLFDDNLKLKKSILVKNPEFKNNIAPNIEHNIGYHDNHIFASTFFNPTITTGKSYPILNSFQLNDTLLNHTQITNTINYPTNQNSSDNLFIPKISFSNNSMAQNNCIYILNSEQKLHCLELAKNEIIISHYCLNNKQCHYITQNAKSEHKTICNANNQCFQFKNANQIKTIVSNNKNIIALRNYNYQNFIEVYELP